ncbi:MAG: aryl-sulfate sulfotransferase [Bacteroidales bacterium]
MPALLLKFHSRFLLLLVLTGFLAFPGHSQNFPPLAVVIEDSAATSGYYFMIPYTNGMVNNFDRGQLILDRFGRIVFYRIFPVGLNLTPAIDFKLQPNGMMSYFNTNRDKYIIMDSTFTDVDSIDCVHGFVTDQHDLQILPDNHYLLFGTEIRFMNLSSYHWFGVGHNLPGGTNAQVFGVVIQEFDENKALIWEWKSHDHYQFGDVDQVWLSNPNKVDWTHANAVEKDNDGNILLSMRHFNEITKIDHSTGNIIWRLGGKQNQFAFPNDPIRFTGQHDIRRVNDSSITLFDNGQYTTPQVCRALEYSLDEINKVATLTWEYIYDSARFSLACGNHQYLENGNHLVDFGFTPDTFPWMVVVKPDKSKVLEFSYPTGFISYRAFNYPTLPWELNRPIITCQKTGSNFYLLAEPGHSGYRWSTGETTPSIRITHTGDYWVFVPYGTGFLSSERFNVTDILNPCLTTPVISLEGPVEFGFHFMPNPASEQLLIVFNIPTVSPVTLSILTLQGVEVRKNLPMSYSAGKHETSMNVSSLPHGIYFLSMVTNKSRIVKKLIVQ